MAVITGFSVEKNISSSKQLIGFTKYRFSLHLKINIIISEEDNILLALSSPPLPPLTTLQTAGWSELSGWQW